MTTGSWGRAEADVWTCTYRLLRANRSLVYVGVTDDFESRMRNHSRKRWWPEVASKDVIWFPDRLSALYEESRAIDFESPTYNDREGISPFGLQPFSTAGQSRPDPIVTRYDKDKFFSDYRRRRPAGLTCYGEPTGAVMVPIEWYERARALLGEPPVDLSSMNAVAVDKL